MRPIIVNLDIRKYQWHSLTNIRSVSNQFDRVLLRIQNQIVYVYVSCNLMAKCHGPTTTITKLKKKWLVFYRRQNWSFLPYVEICNSTLNISYFMSSQFHAILSISMFLYPCGSANEIRKGIFRRRYLYFHHVFVVLLHAVEICSRIFIFVRSIFLPTRKTSNTLNSINGFK